LRKETNRLRNRYRQTPNKARADECKSVRQRYKAAIQGAKDAMWRKYVEEADEKTIWQVKKYIDKPPSPYYIPTIEGETSNKGKSHQFKTTFFPPPPPANLSDIATASYPDPVPCNSVITDRQIQRAINKLAPQKSPGPDEISNLTLKSTFKIARHHLRALIQASINTSHYPTAFKTTTTVVMRKPQKPDYTKANAYRPIALENTLGKIIESVITELMSYIIETYQLIPQQHFGGRPGRAGEDAMAVLVEKIKEAWKRREVYSAVFMDVAGAFNNTHPKRLIHNMKMKKIPAFIVRWTDNFLMKRETRLRFNGVESDRITVEAGVPQGSPLSPILYLLYNSELLSVLPPEIGGLLCLGFIDNIAYGVQGRNDVENARILERLLRKAEDWRQRHGARFETTKYVLIHFTKNRNQSTTAHIEIDGTIIEPSDEAKYLGVIFDRKLSFKSHVQYASRKGMAFALAISRVANCTCGPTYQQTRNLFTSVVAPRMDHAAIIWHKPTKQGQIIPPSSTTKLDSAQRTAIKAILGTFRTTPSTALQIETSLPPTHLRLRNKVRQSYTRMHTSPLTNPVKAAILKASTSTSKSHITPFEYIMRVFPQYTRGEMETIKPFPRPPWWIPPFTTNEFGNKKSAKAKHSAQTHDPDTLCIYTDGSAINGHVGAAAYCPTTSETKRQYLGTTQQHNVYSVELTGFELAIDIAKESPTHFTKCIIYADSQAAVQGINKPSKQSGQEVIMAALTHIESHIESRSMTVDFAWIPGHEEIEGKEEADKAAKEAANSRGDDESIATTRHRPLKSATAMLIKQSVTEDWKRTWETQLCDAQHLRRIIIKPNTVYGTKLYKGIPRQQAAQLARLRTGHCGLNQYLHRFGHADSPLCDCDNGAIETVNHYLLHCPRYSRQRAKLTRNVGVGGMRVEKLLGYREIVGNTLEYIKETRRFDF
jgi:ribonuclease HI